MHKPAFTMIEEERDQMSWSLASVMRLIFKSVSAYSSTCLLSPEL